MPMPPHTIRNETDKFGNNVTRCLQVHLHLTPEPGCKRAGEEVIVGVEIEDLTNCEESCVLVDDSESVQFHEAIVGERFDGFPLEGHGHIPIPISRLWWHVSYKHELPSVFERTQHL